MKNIIEKYEPIVNKDSMILYKAKYKIFFEEIPTRPYTGDDKKGMILIYILCIFSVH